MRKNGTCGPHHARMRKGKEEEEKGDEKEEEREEEEEERSKKWRSLVEEIKMQS